MKTREELILEFQKKFDKERRKEIWNLWYKLPEFLFLNGVVILFIIFLVFIAAEGFTYFLSCVCLLGMVVGNYTYLSDFFETFNSIEKAKQIKQQIHEKAKIREKWFEKRKSIEPVCDGGTLEIWMKLALEYHCFSAEHIKEMILQEGETLEQELFELNTQWQIYEKCPEKNFWQYVKSKKWLKKQTTKSCLY